MQLALVFLDEIGVDYPQFGLDASPTFILYQSAFDVIDTLYAIYNTANTAKKNESRNSLLYASFSIFIIFQY